MIISLEYLTKSTPEYSTITFSKIPAKQNIEKGNKHPTKKKNTDNKIKFPDKTENKKTIETKIPSDSIIIKNDTTETILTGKDSSNYDLQFAQSVLDTFLVRNPVYAKFILEEQAKGIAKRKFTRQSIVRKLNDELHKYLKEKYPEGSDHAVNKYTGPGIQIPIGDLINLVKKIFD